MSDYRRYRIPGGTYFFTVNLLERHPNDLLTRPTMLVNNALPCRLRRPVAVDIGIQPDKAQSITNP